MGLSDFDVSQLDDKAKAELKKIEKRAGPLWKKWSSYILPGLGFIAGLVVCGLAH